MNLGSFVRIKSNNKIGFIKSKITDEVFQIFTQDNDIEIHSKDNLEIMEIDRDKLRLLSKLFDLIKLKHFSQLCDTCKQVVLLLSNVINAYDKLNS